VARGLRSTCSRRAGSSRRVDRRALGQWEGYICGGHSDVSVASQYVIVDSVSTFYSVIWISDSYLFANLPFSPGPGELDSLIFR